MVPLSILYLQQANHILIDAKKLVTTNVTEFSYSLSIMQSIGNHTENIFNFNSEKLKSRMRSNLYQRTTPNQRNLIEKVISEDDDNAPLLKKSELPNLLAPVQGRDHIN